jgi:hypothetical protein
MLNKGTKLATVIGGWVGMAIGMFIMPISILPLLIFGWFAWNWSSPLAIYSFIYDKETMAIAGVLILLFLIWAEGFKASLDEAALLARLKKNLIKPGLFWRYYLHRNRKMIAAYESRQAGQPYDTGFDGYLAYSNPRLYRYHTTAFAFFPDWMTESVSGHFRRGHVRHTKNGPVNVRSHHVSSHLRTRRR